MVGSAHDDPDFDPKDEASQAELSDRRDRLNRMLEGRRKAEEADAAKVKSSSTGYGKAMKLSSDFIAGIVVGGGIGWAIDQWFGTLPFGLVIFLLLGFAAGVLNVLRSVGYVADPEARLGGKKSDGDSSK
ncbi:AtpZ/AtpI family protein [Roseibium suaedae]|uniref:ATP synthase protein I n=1 Tax=Roseibium suaedae TaxID=735517 RepID=A0A1M7AY51_9HYPH|nr:AtpZ/AtpI family protein [Roseibium suaedae]SHL47644.1 ATP synthase protein I [Roseibium suaedae]